MSTVIKAHNIGKKYTIRHESQARYTTLGERISTLFASRTKVETEEFWALKDVNFEIAQGDRVGIIGRNGAGKSTLLKLLSRITEPSTGSIGLKGRVASLLEVGTGFHPELTGRENIYLNGAILGMSRRDINLRLDEIIAFSEVDRFLDTPVKRYSSGMYVRLAFSVAAHLEPDILIVDEVLAVGDAQFQKKCLGKMKDVGQEGRTVLFVSHSMAAIQQLCTNAIILEHGTLNFKGSVKEATDKYLLSGEESSSFKNLKSIPRAEKFGLDATINSFHLLDANNAETTTFKFGQEIFAEMNFTGNRDLKNINLVVGIDSLQNDRIATAISPSKLKLDLIKDQTHTARVRIDLKLNPGTYFVTVAIRQDQSKVVDHIKHVMSFTIIDVREDRLIDEVLLPYGYLSAPDLDWSLA